MADMQFIPYTKLNFAWIRNKMLKILKVQIHIHFIQGWECVTNHKHAKNSKPQRKILVN